MEIKKFQKTTESFTCQNCKTLVVGNGYTNHCPKCLWSRHVDVNPGDRAENCKGMMEPISVESASDEYTIIHQCLECGTIRRNRAAKEDDFDAIVAITREGSIVTII